jgi:hypothetical protein
VVCNSFIQIWRTVQRLNLSILFAPEAINLDSQVSVFSRERAVHRFVVAHPLTLARAGPQVRCSLSLGGCDAKPVMRSYSSAPKS